MHELKRIKIKTNYLRHSLTHLVCTCLLSVGGLLSCGLEDFSYIEHIWPGDYNNTGATINLPSSSAAGYSTYFKYFIIFYRIYTSSVPSNATINSSELRRNINPTLDSDYIYLSTFTDITNTSVNISNLENTFDNRNYFKLTLAETDIDNVLGSGALGGTLNIIFSTNPNQQPTLSINGTPSYFLQRAIDGPSRFFDPQPDRRFLNSDNLRSSSNSPPINIDVAVAGSTSSYTYVSMYIAASGISLELPPRTIYSQPTFIGIFRLTNLGS